jgi:hypothetical protein
VRVPRFQARRLEFPVGRKTALLVLVSIAILLVHQVKVLHVVDLHLLAGDQYRLEWNTAIPLTLSVVALGPQPTTSTTGIPRAQEGWAHRLAGHNALRDVSSKLHVNTRMEDLISVHPFVLVPGTWRARHG